MTYEFDSQTDPDGDGKTIIDVTLRSAGYAVSYDAECSACGAEVDFFEDTEECPGCGREIAKSEVHH